MQDSLQVDDFPSQPPHVALHHGSRFWNVSEPHGDRGHQLRGFDLDWYDRGSAVQLHDQQTLGLLGARCARRPSALAIRTHPARRIGSAYGGRLGCDPVRGSRLPGLEVGGGRSCLSWLELPAQPLVRFPPASSSPGNRRPNTAVLTAPSLPPISDIATAPRRENGSEVCATQSTPQSRSHPLGPSQRVRSAVVTAAKSAAAGTWAQKWNPPSGAI